MGLHYIGKTVVSPSYLYNENPMPLKRHLYIKTAPRLQQNKTGFTKPWDLKYRKIFNIIRTPVSNKIVDHWDVVGASPVGAAPTTSSFST